VGLIPTSSQTVGPFFSIALERLCDENLASGKVQGQPIVIEGSVVDGDGAPVPDALLEFWQADTAGNYAGTDNRQQSSSERDAFRGFGRVATNERGGFRVATIKPGCVKDAKGVECAPHILVSIFMRGLLTRLVTRIYFPGESQNSRDPVLRLVPEGRRGTLVAGLSSTDASRFEWNIVLQGPDETVFFAC
jgi:protocatechuate 3,4-dioxygenase, alpha subunit